MPWLENDAERAQVIPAPTTTPLCTVFIVENLTLVRRLMRRALDQEPGLTVIGDAADPESAAPVVARTKPSVTLVATFARNHRMAEAIRRLVAHTSVLLIGGAPESIDIIQAIQAGVRGCLTYASTMPQIASAIHEVHAGGTMLDAPGLSALFDQISHRSRSAHHGPAAAIKRLTPKERAVLAMLVQGMSKAEIAAELTISPETVRTHAQRLLTKLGVHSRLEAVAYVNQHDLLQDLLSS